MYTILKLFVHHVRSKNEVLEISARSIKIVDEQTDKVHSDGRKIRFTGDNLKYRQIHRFICVIHR